MLCELSVQNLALIEDVRVELEAGFCAWTGETGAGKTLLLTALGLLLGDRGSADLIREGTNELRVVGRFVVSKLKLRQGIAAILDREFDSDEILLQRRLNRQGRSAAYLNDEPATLATIKRIGELLVDVHGQRETHSLLQPDYQLEQLDAFGDLNKTRGKFVILAEFVRQLRHRLRNLEAERQQRLRELNMIRFEKEEIDEADPRTNELAELAKEREILANAQAVQQFAQHAVARLYDEDGAFYEVLGKIERDADDWAELDPSLKEIATRLRTLADDCADAVRMLRPWAEHNQADPARLEEVELRLQKLKRLESKYARSIAGILTYRQTLDTQEKELQTQEEDRGTLETELMRAWKQLRQMGEEMAKNRRKVAKKFAKAVEKELSELGMPDARLEAQLDAIEPGDDPITAEVPNDGFDRLEFLLAANAGEPARPLRKVASGGELSRTMLALKTVLAGHDEISTLIFDEIDANVGGRLGDVVGSKLARLGRTHQIICVTHLPQVASYALHQWTIRKTRQGKRTTTAITSLQEKERVEELSSMLRGESKSATTRQEAEAMLAAARKKRG